ncbi:MAG: hypothetical protein BYD32DRAFT_457195 [Podila humilis]|nr:MAG: hypothetical protein BYD32DRAFT_457195 [Podila humilis]
MQETQPFGIAGTTSDIKNIDVNNFNEQNVIRWEDIEQIFPGVEHICNGCSVVRNSNGVRVVPYRFKHCPGAVLDVFSAPSVHHARIDFPVATSSLALIDGQAYTPTDAQAIIFPVGPHDNPEIENLAIPSTDTLTDTLTDTPIDTPTDAPTDYKVIEALQLLHCKQTHL